MHAAGVIDDGVWQGASGRIPRHRRRVLPRRLLRADDDPRRAGRVETTRCGVVSSSLRSLTARAASATRVGRDMQAFTVVADHSAFSWRLRWLGRWSDPVQEFLATEIAGGVILAVAALCAVLWATLAPHGYEHFWQHPIHLHIGSLVRNPTREALAENVLMPLFFFVVGLEIKREITIGDLSDMRVARLPIFAALGGMIVPALVYAVIAHGGPGANGWGIPMATDIAFVVGVLRLVGRRAPSSLVVMMLAIAVVDDIGAILVIAGWYSSGIQMLWIAAAILCGLLAWVLVRAGFRSIPVYVCLGVGSCAAMANGGVSPTICAVGFGLLIPMAPWRGRDPHAGSGADGGALEQALHWVHPWSSFVALPVFALSSAGVALSVSAIHHAWVSPVAWAIAIGLIVGKPIGVLAGVWGAVRLRWGALPDGLTWPSMIAGALLAGIGFTVSLFIANLAFHSSAFGTDARIAILAASLASALIGVAVLWSRTSSAP